MRELQNLFNHKTMKKSRKKLVMMAAAQLAVCALLSGCITKVRDSVQNLPESVALVSHNANDRGYPDLSKIPPVPTNMKTDADWADHQNKLESQRVQLENAPNSRQPTAQEADIKWSEPLKVVLENDPRFAPAPKDENAIAWAARMRALLNSNTKPETEK